MKLTFFGGVGTVTGSKYLLEQGAARILVDCGLFQGFKQLRLRNWAPLPVPPSSISAVLLTHAHLDHSGYVPLLVRNGFSGPIFCSESTRDLCEILLTDSGHLQERDAEFANRHGTSKHKPALPLYTEADARRSLRQFRVLPFDQSVSVDGAFRVHLRRAGHILGAATLEIAAAGRTIVFSGDLGRYDSATMIDPETVTHADYLVVESTYGDRRHDPRDPENVLSEIINRTTERGGTMVIPSFAVGRAQTLLYHLERLRSSRRIAAIPIFLDSPMAIDASELFCRNIDDHRLSAQQCRSACRVADYVRDVEGSKRLDSEPMPKIIISASGMATGGRVLHHLKRYAPDPRSAIIFAGFQAGGTRGASMVGGADQVKIHGEYVRIRAEVQNLPMLSAHADIEEIVRWLKNFKRPPKATFITHGEPAAADAERHRIEEELRWPAMVPDYREEIELT